MLCKIKDISREGKKHFSNRFVLTFFLFFGGGGGCVCVCVFVCVCVCVCVCLFHVMVLSFPSCFFLFKGFLCFDV